MPVASPSLLRPARRPRFAAALLALAWLGVAAAPCHALGAAPPEAPAPAGHGQHTGHGTHDTDSRDCGHCPDVPAGGAGDDCTGLSAANCHSAEGALKRDAGQLPVLAPPPALPSARIVAPACRLQLHPAGHDFHAGPSLQQRYCSYLK